MGTNSPKADRRKRLTIAGVLLAVAVGTVGAVHAGDAKGKSFKKWVDESGVVHYGDQIPPSEVDRGHTDLNVQGIQVETVPPVQTIEEIQRERELERLRAEQGRLKQQQDAADQVLLRTFRSIDDLVMAREGKVTAIDVVIGVARSNIRRHQAWLQKLMSDAANLERAGKPVPQHLVESIDNTERAIRDAYATIVAREQEKNQVRQSFDRDLKRFRQLKDIPADTAEVPKESSRPLLRNLVPCRDAEQCDRLWARAVAYVRAQTTTAIRTSGPNILITAPPETQEDLSLTLSRIQEKDTQSVSIFLDLQCKNRSIVDTSCKGERAQKVLDGFREAVAKPGPEADAAPAARSGAATSGAPDKPGADRPSPPAGGATLGRSAPLSRP